MHKRKSKQYSTQRGIKNIHQEAYDAKCEIVAVNAKRFNDDCDTFDLVPDDIDENAMLSVWDIAAPSISQDDAAIQSSGYKHCRK